MHIRKFFCAVAPGGKPTFVGPSRRLTCLRWRSPVASVGIVIGAKIATEVRELRDQPLLYLALDAGDSVRRAGTMVEANREAPRAFTGFC